MVFLPVPMDTRLYPAFLAQPLADLRNGLRDNRFVLATVMVS
jgi:hypothetical protein